MMIMTMMMMMMISDNNHGTVYKIARFIFYIYFFIVATIRPTGELKMNIAYRPIRLVD